MDSIEEQMGIFRDNILTMKNKVAKEEFSNKVTRLSFFMSFLVICIHSSNLTNLGIEEDHSTVNYWVTQAIGVGISGFAVPMFFVLSGFWLFKLNHELIPSYYILTQRIKKKTFTLLIPYLLWNTYSYIFYIILTRMNIASQIMNNADIVELNFQNAMEAILNHKYYFTFWYMEELIFMTALSPVLLFVLKKKKVAELILLSLIPFIAYDMSFYLFAAQSLFFFLLGGYISIYHCDLFESKVGKNTAIVYLILFVMTAIVRTVSSPYIARLLLIIQPFEFWMLMDLFKLKKAKWFETQSFSVYAFHAIPVTIVMKICLKISGGGTRLSLAI